eukprot:s2263_g3.t1
MGCVSSSSAQPPALPQTSLAELAEKRDSGASLSVMSTNVSNDRHGGRYAPELFSPSSEKATPKSCTKILEAMLSPTIGNSKVSCTTCSSVRSEGW